MCAALLAKNVEQVLSIVALAQWCSQSCQFGCVNIAEAKRNLVRTGDLKPLPFLKRFNKVGRLQQGLVRAERT